MVEKSINLFFLCVYLILQSSYGDDDTKDVQVLPSPRPVAHPNDYRYINCSDTGDQFIKITWNFWERDKARSGDGYISLDSIKLQHAGRYYCAVLNGAGEAGAIADVIVEVAPKISLTSHRIIAHVGEYHSINCSATGDQPIEISWSSLGRDMPNSVYTKDGYISFNSTQLQDAGKYLCVAKNGAGKASDVTHLIVEVPLKISLTSHRIVAHPGEYHSINCSATGNQPIEISWSSLGRDMPNSVYTKDGYISFNSTQLQDAGRYLCVAKNAAGKASDITDLIVEVPPSIKLSSTKVELRLGESGFVDCYASGDQPMNISWSASGSDLPNSVYIKDRVIGFNNIQEDHAGKYMCVAKNRAGKASAEVEVIVKVPPSIFLNTRKLITFPNERNHFIYCNATGDQPIDIYWLPYQRVMPSSVSINGGYITFDTIQYEHRGLYVCVAKNRNGIAESYTEVTVGVSPTITLSSNSILVDRGEHVYINCSATGDQPIEISWSAVGHGMPNSVYTRDGYLSFNSTQLQDSGIYVCVAENRAGKAEARAVVIVGGPPQVTLTTPRRVVVHLGENPHINCTATGNEPMEIHWMAWKRAMPGSVFTNKGYIQFYNIQYEHAGVYWCMATNSVGTGGAIAEIIVKD